MKKIKFKFPKLKSPRPKLQSTRRSVNITVISLTGAAAIALLALVGSFYYTTQQNKFTGEYLSYIAEQKLLSQRIATRALDATRGQEAAFVELLVFRDRYQETLDYLRSGNVSTGLPPMADTLSAELTEVEQAWDEYKFNLESIVQNQQTVAAITDHANQIDNVLPTLKTYAVEVAQLLAGSSRVDPQTLFVASQQALFIEQIESNLNVILGGGQDAVSASDQFGRDFDRFARYVSALANGDSLLQVKRVVSAEGQNKLAEQLELYEEVQDNISGILAEAENFVDIKVSADQIQGISPEMLQGGVDLETAINLQAGGLLGVQNVTNLGYLAGVLMIVFSVLLVFSLIGSARTREKDTSEINRRNQEAILRLLDEMTHLAEGDLTTHTTVTEDITGAIADSVNFSIDALRTLVETINDTVAQVSSSSEQTQAVTNRLSAASSQQAKEITSTTNAISHMAATMDKVSKSAMTSADVALQSVKIAGKGADTVRRNIEAMDTIRDTIQETSKRIKRLGESSQQIGEIVALITDIADRTNILALNAAIQASSAGEAGRGFAVVADEVQRLAERAGNATKQISVLVETIQTDTNEAVSSMEQSTAGVVKGAQLAEDAGSALAEIETVSKELAGLIQGISEEAREQASAATNISESMNVIQRITVETSEGTKETAVSVGNLTELANELRHSVAGFKLPDASEIQTAVNG